jgi:acyl dehydratase
MRSIGYWLEDFQGKPSLRSAGRTIGEADLINYAGLSGDYSPVHTDEEACAKTDFGTRIGHGLLGLSIAQGLMWRTGYTAGTGVASVAWSAWTFRKPFYIGDTLHVEWDIAEARPSASRPGQGIITENVRIVNQKGETVQEGQHVMLVRRRPESK